LFETNAEENKYLRICWTKKKSFFALVENNERFGVQPKNVLIF